MSGIDRDRYEVLAELGRGGMGVVYRVRDRVQDREVALKAILGGGDPMLTERFVREARATAALEHPSLVPTYELGREGERLHFTMRLVQGTTLTAAIRSGRRSLAELVRSHVAIARGVAYAHARGLVHRDLKPDNVMVEADGSVQILDWGLVGASGEAEVVARPATSSFDDSKLTMAGELMGTPAYMSPEQAEGRSDEVGPASDVYALGAILYEILTGHPPFRGSSAREVLRLVREGKFVPPSRATQGQEVPAELEAICLAAMAREASARYASAGSMADDLEAWLEGRTVSVCPPPWPVRLGRFLARHPKSMASVALVLLISTTAGAILAQQRRSFRLELAGREARRRESLEEDLRSADRQRRDARFDLDAWEEAYVSWRKQVEAEDAVVSSWPDLPPALPGEDAGAYFQRIRSAAADGLWDERTILQLQRDGSYAVAPGSIGMRHAVRSAADAWRRKAYAADSLYLRVAGAADGTDPRQAAIDLARQETEIERRMFQARDRDERSPEWARAIGSFRDWETREDLPPHWWSLADSLERLEVRLRDAGLDPAADDQVRRVRWTLDGRATVRIDPLDPGWSGSLHRLTGDTLWARRLGDELVLDPGAGLERIAPVAADGLRLDVLAGEFLLVLASPGGDEVRQPFVAARGEEVRVLPDQPREFPPGCVRVPTAIHRISQVRAWRTTEGFFLQRFEVSLADLRDFLVATGAGSSRPWQEWAADGASPLRLVEGTWQPATGETWDHPARNLNFVSAAQYAAWRSARDGWDWRVPTMRERCLAAEGVLGHRFPWGDAIEEERCPPRGAPVGVDTWPASRSIHGAHHILGNVSEWASSATSPSMVCLQGGHSGLPMEKWNGLGGAAAATTARPDFGFRLICRRRLR